MNYYSNTMGQPITGGAYHGRESSTTTSGSGDSTAYYYIKDLNSDTLITLNSKLGVATASDTILMQLSE
jgi:hypothetical protein